MSPYTAKAGQRVGRPRTQEERVSLIRANLEKRLEHYTDDIKCIFFTLGHFNNERLLVLYI